MTSVLCKLSHRLLHYKLNLRKVYQRNLLKKVFDLYQGSNSEVNQKEIGQFREESVDISSSNRNENSETTDTVPSDIPDADLTELTEEQQVIVCKMIYEERDSFSKSDEERLHNFC